MISGVWPARKTMPHSAQMCWLSSSAASLRLRADATSGMNLS